MGAHLEDLKDRVFGEWTVKYYSGNKRWHCSCSCGVERDILGVTLRNGESTSCGHNKKNFEDLSDRQIGEWKVLYRNDSRTYMCRCSCGLEKLVQAYHLKHGKSKSCGHDSNKLDDIKGQIFGELEAFEYAGDRSWKCRCSCKNIVVVKAQSLKYGTTRSCGCKSSEFLKETLLTKYGDEVPMRSKNPRQKWQIDVLSSRENLEAYIINKRIAEREVTVGSLAEDLDVTDSAVLHRLDKFNLKSTVKLHENTSRFERTILKIIEKYYSGEIVRHSKDIISPYELDVYIPKLNIAFEINGNYWHSELYKDINYHQKKTLLCAKNGVQLIHIFEHEIINNIDKIELFIKNTLNHNKKRIYARKCIVKQNETQTVERFIDKYHLQGNAKSSINISLHDECDNIVGAMTLGKSRFNKDYDYEIIRLCFHSDLIVVGGLEKMIKYFLNKYKPRSIITYCDISKFKGNGYLRVGFSVLDKGAITKPNYVWCNDDSDIKSRYSTQKSILVEKGLGKEEDTEDEIMHNLGYYKIYNSGNIKLELINK